MPVRNKHSKKNRKQYSQFDTNTRTKKVQTGGGFFWTSNEEEVARYLAHEGVKTIMTDTYSDKDKQKAYILAKQTLHDYLAAMIYRMYKLHGNAIINGHEKKKLEESLNKKGQSPDKIADISKKIKDFKFIKLKKVFESPVKHNGKYDYGRKLYEKTNTSKQQSDTKDIIKFIKITDFLKFLNSDTNQVASLQNLEASQCYTSNRTGNRQQQTIETEKYNKPILYKTEHNATTTYALFGMCNYDKLTPINIQNVIYKYIVSVKQVIAGINNKEYRKYEQYNNAKATFEETTRLLKNRIDIEQMASALFYYSMYDANNPGQQSQTERYGGYGGYGGYGYRGW